MIYHFLYPPKNHLVNINYAKKRKKSSFLLTEDSNTIDLVECTEKGLVDGLNIKHFMFFNKRSSLSFNLFCPLFTTCQSSSVECERTTWTLFTKMHKWDGVSRFRYIGKNVVVVTAGNCSTADIDAAFTGSSIGYIAWSTKRNDGTSTFCMVWECDGQ